MAIRNPKSHLNRQRGIRIEALEKRQLLAAIFGAGEEYESDFLDTASGNTIDLVRMTGASLTIDSNDFHQITNVSIFDLDGDLMYAQFSGAGRLIITLEDSSAQTLDPVLHAGLTGDYVKGQASFFIDGSDASTYFAIFAVGASNDLGTDSAVTGVSGDGIANVTRLNIAADPLAPGGSNFAGIGAANATFSGTSGAVGISAPNIQVQQYVRIGDIDASDGAFPNIVFGDNSTFATVTIHGGDLLQSNGKEIDFGGAQAVELVDGTTAAGDVLEAQALQGVFEGSPTAVDLTATTAEDTPVSGTLLGSDDEGDPITFRIISGSLVGGTATVTGSTYTFTPTADFNGNASFQYVANDGALDSPGASVAITVTAVNDDPTASDISISVDEDGSVAGTFVGSDPDGDAVTFAVVGGAATGSAIGATVTISGAGFIFAPALNETGAGTFQYVSNDGTTDSAAATVTVTVGSEDDAPIIGADIIDSSTQTVTIAIATLLANDSDPEGQALSLTGVGNPVGGAVADVGDGNIVFIFTDPVNVRAGSFDYTVTDGTLSSTGTVNVQINTVPSVDAVAVTIVEDSDATGTLTGTDADGDAITFTIVADSATNGSVVLVGDAFTFTPTADFNGVATFQFIGTDALGSPSAAGTATITITQVNDAPGTADLDAGSVISGGNVDLTGTLSGADVDTDADLNADGGAGETLTFGNVNDALAGGAGIVVDGATGDFTITPGAAQAAGTYSFTIDVTDAAALLATATVNFTLTNNPPTAVGDSESIATNTETEIDVLANDSDNDGDLQTLTIVVDLSQSLSGGTLRVSDDGTQLFYTSAPGFTGDVTFTYAASDDRGATTSNTVTVSLTVEAQLLATPGPDDLQGTPADEVIDGGAGDDTIDGGGGADTLIGGLGNDEITVRADVVNATGGTDPDELDSDTVILAATAIDTIDLTNGTNQNTSVDNNGDPFGTVLTGFENVDGTAVNQILTITGSAVDNTLTGGSGADTILGGGGDDTIFGGIGSDVLLDGGNGDDTIWGGPGNDTIDGGADDDTIFGEDGADIIDTGTGDDTVFGGAGNDTITADTGIDNLSGEDGNDTFIFLTANFDDDDTVSGGAGTDTILVTNTATVIDADFTNVTSVETLDTEAGGNNSVTLDALAEAAGIVTVIADGAGNNTVDASAYTVDISITGGAGGDTLTGGDGNDTLTAGAGGDNLQGNDGDDTFNFLSANLTNGDTVGGDAGDDTLAVTDAATVVDADFTGITSVETLDTSGAGDADTITVGGTAETAGIRTVLTGDGADTVDASAYTEDITITGGAGDDAFTAGSGDDTLSGGDDDDTFLFLNANFDSADTVDGGADDDTIQVTDAATVVDADFTLVTSVETLNVSNGGGNTVTVSALAQAAGVVEVTAGAGGDTIDASAYTVGITLTGGASADTLTGGSGDDTIDGGGGADTIVGGDGADTITGGTGSETLLSGGSGGDTFVFATGEADADDTIDGGADSDTIELVFLITAAGNGTLDDITNIEDVVISVTGTDDEATDAYTLTIANANYDQSSLTIDASAIVASDTLDNTDTFVLVAGGNDADEDFTVIGGAGSDDITTGDGDDTIDGGAGDDTIDSGAGTDNLSGGADDDTFEFLTADLTSADTIDGGGGGDTIQITDTATVVDADFTLVTSVETLTTLNGTDTITLSALAEAAGILNVITGDGGDTVTASGYSVGISLTGGSGADSLTGGSGGDTITGGIGNLYGIAAAAAVNGVGAGEVGR